ncbi:hypothetical protein C8F04DRAFT_1199649 [Mycena alexandri]|uniref:DUF6830 domain-containing protein n=1 Tax=Mycena alexandri TaxID=1745969 RepID=A0AAD6S303_9AGAR|nr:hypothetical protein C8F04DRAFT_1199649 [Mycena alexandri]
MPLFGPPHVHCCLLSSCCFASWAQPLLAPMVFLFSGQQTLRSMLISQKSKCPLQNSNNQGYEAQICRHLDRRDKCDLFDLATSIETAGVDLGGGNLDEELGDDPDFLEEHEQHPLVASLSPGRKRVDYFTYSSALLAGKYPKTPTPFRTFISVDGRTAFHLNRDHVGCRVTVEDASTRFCLPDLKDTLLTSYSVGPQQLLEPETVNAEPPKGAWQSGRGDPVLVNIDDDYHWPRSGLAGHAICQLKLIFRVIPQSDCVAPAGTEQFLAYIQ